MQAISEVLLASVALLGLARRSDAADSAPSAPRTATTPPAPSLALMEAGEPCFEGVARALIEAGHLNPADMTGYPF